MIKDEYIKKAFDKFTTCGYAGIMLLRRELRYSEYVSRCIMDMMVHKGIISKFNGTEKQYIIIEDKKEALEILDIK